MLCLMCPPTYLLHIAMFRSELGGWLSFVDWLMLSETVLSGSHLFRYEFCTLTIVTAILLQDIGFPERLLKLLGCPGQFLPLP